MSTEPIEDAWDLRRDPGSHQDDIDVGEHRSVQAGKRGELDLLEVVDADDPVVALLRQEHLDEVRQDQQALPPRRQRGPEQRGELVALALDELAGLISLVVVHAVSGGRGRSHDRPVAPNVAIQDGPGDLLRGKGSDRSSHVPPLVAVPQLPHEDRVQGRSGDDPNLPERGDLPHESPTGDASPHTALYQPWQHGRIPRSSRPTGDVERL